MRYMCAICMWYMLKWHIMADLINSACWLIVFVCRAVTLFPLISSPLHSLFVHFTSSSCFPLCYLPALLRTWVKKWQSTSHEVKCILTFWFHCSRQPNIIWSQLLSMLIHSDRTTFGSLSFSDIQLFFFVFFQHLSLYLIFQTHAVWLKPKMEWIVCHFLNQLSCQLSYLGSMQICIPWL